MPSQVAAEAFARIGPGPDETNLIAAKRFGEWQKQIADANEATKMAQESRDRANEIYAKVKEDLAMQSDPVKQNEVRLKAAQAVLEASQAEASANVAVSKNIGGAVSATTNAQNLSVVLKDTHDAISTVAGTLFEKTGINPTTDFIPKADLQLAAETLRAYVQAHRKVAMSEGTPTARLAVAEKAEANATLSAQFEATLKETE